MRKLLSLLGGAVAFVVASGVLLLVSYEGPIPEPYNTILGALGLTIFLIGVLVFFAWWATPPIKVRFRLALRALEAGMPGHAEDWLESSLYCRLRPETRELVRQVLALIAIGEYEQASAALELALKQR